MRRALAGRGLVVFIILFIFACDNKKAPTLFESLDSTQTGINFVNRLEPISNGLSIVDYLYYYNGAGVAAGDVDNDGLTDLFFVSNNGDNKLYLNKGNFRFEDASAKAGLKSFSEWKTGVTMVDVNGDGYLDIYVCAVANYMKLEGANELFINNGDGTFEEHAADYNLNFSGFSTQSAFFDYDHDGDLDMYLLNHATHTSRSYDKVIARILPDKDAGDYLFRNNNGKFEDVSKEAGIYQAAMGYGLGITIADIDNDGWEDIYATNDFHEDDYYYINNHDGTFREAGKESFAHFSRFSMGCDVADINNDGYEDIMTLDMSSDEEVLEKASMGEDALDLFQYKRSFGYHYQFSRNTLQINNGGKKFNDWAILSGVASTDWSWATLIEDYNNDGLKDIFITNGIVKRPNDLDYLKFSHEDSMLYAAQLTDAQLEMAINRMPEGKSHNFIFEGDSALKFKDRSVDWGMDRKDISNGAAYADLDNDGDLDLVTNNLNESPGIYRNKSEQFNKNNYLTVSLKGAKGNSFGLGAKVYVGVRGHERQLRHMMPTRGFLSSVEPRLHFGLSTATNVDVVIVVWNDGSQQLVMNVAPNSTIVFDQKDAKQEELTGFLYYHKPPVFSDATSDFKAPYKHTENTYLDMIREGLMPFMISKEGPALAVGDVNGDGLDDLFAGGAKHQIASLLIQGKGGFTPSKQEAFRTDSVFEDTDAAFIDVDKDGDLDLYVVSGGNEFLDQMPEQYDRLYINDGKGKFTRAVDALPPMPDNKSCVRPFDFDKDGDIDLFVGGRVVGYNYGKTPGSYILVNDGHGKFADNTDDIAPDIRHAGMITDAAWSDVDKDGKPEVIVTGDWMSPRLFEFDNGKFVEQKDLIAATSPIRNVNGFWQCLSVNDIDNDGDMDFVAGNLGLNNRLRKNGDQSELVMSIGDFDSNGRREHVVSYNRADGKFYPLASRDELAKQMPSLITKRFNEYRKFSGKSVDDIIGKGLRDDSVTTMKVDQFASLYFENVGNSQFVVHQLPNEAQLSKVFSITTGDLDKDNIPDIVIAGNFNGGSSYQPVYDGSVGVFLKGVGKGQFRSLPSQSSGLWLDGQVRSIKPVRTNEGIVYVIAENNGALKFIRAK